MENIGEKYPTCVPCQPENFIQEVFEEENHNRRLETTINVVDGRGVLTRYRVCNYASMSNTGNLTPVIAVVVVEEADSEVGTDGFDFAGL